MPSLVLSHKHIFFTLSNQKTPLKIGIQGKNLHIYPTHIDTLKQKLKKKFFFEILKS